MHNDPGLAADIVTNRRPQHGREGTAERSYRDQDTDTETIDTIDSVANVGRDPVSALGSAELCRV